MSPSTDANTDDVLSTPTKKTPTRLQRRREQNRLSAQRSRQRQRDQTEFYIRECQKLQSSNTEIRRHIREMDDTRRQLETALREHAGHCRHHRRSTSASASSSSTAAASANAFATVGRETNTSSMQSAPAAPALPVLVSHDSLIDTALHSRSVSVDVTQVCIPTVGSVIGGGPLARSPVAFGSGSVTTINADCLGLNCSFGVANAGATPAIGGSAEPPANSESCSCLQSSFPLSKPRQTFSH